MNKLSNKSIEKFKIFLNDEEFSYISLTRHEFKILFSIYNSVISLTNELETKIHELIQEINQLKESERDTTATVVLINDENKELKKRLQQNEAVIDKVKILLASLAVTSTWDKQKEINEAIKILESKEDYDGRIHYKKYD